MPAGNARSTPDGAAPAYLSQQVTTPTPVIYRPQEGRAMSTSQAESTVQHITTLRHEPGNGYVWTCTCGAKATTGKQHLLAEQDAQKHERDMTTEAAPESPFDYSAYEAGRLTLGTLVPGVDYTLVRNNDSSDHGRAELFFADQADAERYVTRLKAAFAAGALGEPHFHPQPGSLDLLIFTVTRRV